MKKILVISWFYPPINSSEGLVTYKLINNSKFFYDVFTQRKDIGWSYGKNVEYNNNSNVTSIFAESDNIQKWVEEAVSYFDKNKEKYDIIMTRSMPQESHIVGLLIKKKYPNIKWIASFGDPIKNNPYNHLRYVLYPYFSKKNMVNKNMSLRQTLSIKRILRASYWNIKHYNDIKFRKELNLIEENTIKNADYVILNNKSQEKYMLDGYSDAIKKKGYVINHSYDSNMYLTVEKKEKKKKQFVFIGHLDEIRNAYALLNAIKLLNEEHKDLSSKAEFVFYGEMGSGDKLFIIDNFLLDVVKIEKSVSYSDSLKIMQNADWLIHIDANIGAAFDENIFFAAKIADYFGSGTNIMAVTMQEGNIVDILNKSNSLVLSFSSEEIKNYLYLIIYENYQREGNNEYKKKFDSKNVAKEFDIIVEKLR